MPRAVQGALPERRDRGRAVRRRPRRAGRIAGNAVRGGPLRRLQGRQAGQGPDRRPPLVLGGPVLAGERLIAGLGATMLSIYTSAGEYVCSHERQYGAAPHRFLEPGEPAAASRRQAGRVAQQLGAVGVAQPAAGLHGRPRQARIGRRPEADEGPGPAFGLGCDRRRDAMRAGIDRQDRRRERRGGRRQGRGRRHRVRRARRPRRLRRGAAEGGAAMAIRSKGDAERMRALARRLYISNDTIDWFLSSSNAAQLRAVSGSHRARDGGSGGVQAREAVQGGGIPQVKSFEGYDFSQVAFSRRLRRGRPEIAVVRRSRAGLRVPRADGPRKDPPRDSRRPRVRDGGEGGALLHRRRVALALSKARRAALEAMMRDIAKNDLVILDEFGYVPSTRKARGCSSRWCRAATRDAA